MHISYRNGHGEFLVTKTLNKINAAGSQREISICWNLLLKMKASANRFSRNRVPTETGKPEIPGK